MDIYLCSAWQCGLPEANITAHTLQVSVLSGGEKARLALAKFMLTRGSLLVREPFCSRAIVQGSRILAMGVTVVHHGTLLHMGTMLRRLMAGHLLP